jgi:hypothetical protein
MSCRSMRWSEEDGVASHQIGEGLQPISDAVLEPLDAPCGSYRNCRASRVPTEVVGQPPIRVVRPPHDSRPLPSGLPLWERSRSDISTI